MPRTGARWKESADHERNQRRLRDAIERKSREWADEVYHAYGYVKKAAAVVNTRAARLTRSR
jgi:fumarate hydratase class II